MTRGENYKEEEELFHLVSVLGACNNDIICPYSLMRGEGSLDSRFVHLDTSYQHQDTEDTGRLDTRYRWL